MPCVTIRLHLRKDTSFSGISVGKCLPHVDDVQHPCLQSTAQFQSCERLMKYSQRRHSPDMSRNEKDFSDRNPPRSFCREWRLPALHGFSSVEGGIFSQSRKRNQRLNAPVLWTAAPESRYLWRCGTSQTPQSCASGGRRPSISRPARRRASSRPFRRPGPPSRRLPASGRRPCTHHAPWPPPV